MDFIRWIFNNFGIFFGAVFLFYIFLMIRRLTALYDLLRFIPRGEKATCLDQDSNRSLFFLENLFNKLDEAAKRGAKSIDCLIDAIWSEVDCRVSVHFTAINGYVNTLILVGFAGTIFGSMRRSSG